MRRDVEQIGALEKRFFDHSILFAIKTHDCRLQVANAAVNKLTKNVERTFFLNHKKLLL